MARHRRSTASRLPGRVSRTTHLSDLVGCWLFPARRRPVKIIILHGDAAAQRTGELHLGHALTASLQDALARWHRMLGDPTLWVPGKDHAGIATQWVVERMLASEGTGRHALGRERFEERIWEWVARYGDTIDEQHRRLGTSCDWSRIRFTLDPGPARAVRTTFVNLFNKGLIYRHERIFNWCPRCATALSDLEGRSRRTGWEAIPHPVPAG